MHISFALFADAANISQEGKLNILGVFDAVQVGALPTMHPRATLVVRLKATRDDLGAHALGLSWVNPRGAELWTSSGEINVGAPPPHVAEMDLPIVAAIDLPIDQPGAFLMRITLRGQIAAEVPLQVSTAGPPTRAVVPGGGLGGALGGGLVS
jgi:hypothetical protein